MPRRADIIAKLDHDAIDFKYRKEAVARGEPRTDEDRVLFARPHIRSARSFISVSSDCREGSDLEWPTAAAIADAVLKEALRHKDPRTMADALREAYGFAKGAAERNSEDSQLAEAEEHITLALMELA